MARRSAHARQSCRRNLRAGIVSGAILRNALGLSKPLLERAAREEEDHLNWTLKRLEALGARPSWLSPLWYGGAFTIGWLAGKAGDRASLGFMAETERQVTQHLERQLARLPVDDAA